MEGVRDVDGLERSELWAERESVQVWAKRESEQVWAKTPLVNGPDENQGGEKFWLFNIRDRFVTRLITAILL